MYWVNGLNIKVSKVNWITYNTKGTSVSFNTTFICSDCIFVDRDYYSDVQVIWINYVLVKGELIVNVYQCTRCLISLLSRSKLSEICSVPPRLNRIDTRPPQPPCHARATDNADTMFEHRQDVDCLALGIWGEPAPWSAETSSSGPSDRHEVRPHDLLTPRPLDATWCRWRAADVATRILGTDAWVPSDQVTQGRHQRPDDAAQEQRRPTRRTAWNRNFELMISNNLNILHGVSSSAITEL